MLVMMTVNNIHASIHSFILCLHPLVHSVLMQLLIHLSCSYPQLPALHPLFMHSFNNKSLSSYGVLGTEIRVMSELAPAGPMLYEKNRQISESKQRPM